MAPAAERKRSSRMNQWQMDATLRTTLQGLAVRGIPAKDLTLVNLRQGLQQQPDKWAPVACQLITAAPAACQAALCADEALVTGLAAHLAKACSSMSCGGPPAQGWLEELEALTQLLTWDCAVVLAADTIIPIYMHSLGSQAAAALNLTSYLLTHQSLAEAVLQHPTLLVGIIRQLSIPRSEGWQVPIHGHIVMGVVGLIPGNQPMQLAAQGPFISELCQMLAAGNPEAAFLLAGLSMKASGRRLITSQPQLLAALAGALQGPNAAWPNTVVWMTCLHILASTRDTSSVILSQPAFCQYLVEGMATALRCAAGAGVVAVQAAWDMLQMLVRHKPSRHVLLTWNPDQQQSGKQGGQQATEQGESASSAPPPSPPAAPAPAGAAVEAPAAVPGATAAAGGSSSCSSSILPAVAAAIQRLPVQALKPAGAVFSTLLEAAPDQQQLLEALQVSSWLNSIHVQGMSEAAQAPWAKAVSLLLGQPAGRAALWAAPRLLRGVLLGACQGLTYTDVEDPLRDRWRVLRDHIRVDAGYQAALLQGLRANSADWVSVLCTEVAILRDTLAGSCGPCSPAYNVLHLPSLSKALAAACKQEAHSCMWVLLRHLLSIPPGHALLDAHKSLVTAVARLFSRAADSHFGPILLDMDGQGDRGAELRTYVLSKPRLLKGLVMGAVCADRDMRYQFDTVNLAHRPWFQQAVEGSGQVLDALLRALGPGNRPRQPGQWGRHFGPSCQEAVLAQLNKEALFPKLLQRLSSPGDMKLVQGAWNGLDWLRRNRAPWDQDVPAALGNMVKAAGRAGGWAAAAAAGGDADSGAAGPGACGPEAAAAAVGGSESTAGGSTRRHWWWHCGRHWWWRSS